MSRSITNVFVITFLFVSALNAAVAPPVAIPNVSIKAPLGAAPTHVSAQVDALPAPQVAADEAADVYLNFENATLSGVVNYLSEQKKMNIIPHKDLAAVKVSITTRAPLTLSRAWNVLLTLLDMNGFSLIRAGDVYRVVPARESGKEALPLYSSRTGTAPEALPDTDEQIRYLYFLENAKTEDMQQILNAILPDGSVKTNKDLEALILNGSGMRIKSAMKIITELDIGGLKQSIEILDLTYADAMQIAALFQDIIGSPSGKEAARFVTEEKKTAAYFSASTKIIPMSIKNSLAIKFVSERL